MFILKLLLSNIVAFWLVMNYKVPEEKRKKEKSNVFLES